MHAAPASWRTRSETIQCERASFDPFFTFFLGGVAVFDDEQKIGAVGVSGLPGEVDEQLAIAAIDSTVE